MKTKKYKFLNFIIFVFLLMPGLCFASNEENPKIQQSSIDPRATFTPVVQIGIDEYKASKINSYEGYFISGVMYDTSAGFNVFYEKGTKNHLGNLVVERKILETVKPRASSAEIVDGSNFFNSFKSFSPNDIVRSGSITRDNMTLLRYNYLDRQQKIRMSTWFDRESGFLVQRAIYDESGTLRSFKIFLKLWINRPFFEPPDFEKRKIIKGNDQFKKYFADDDLQDIDNVVRKYLDDFEKP